MAFVAMSPADEVVTSGPDGTVAWDWRTGAAVWAQPFPVTQIAWAAGGALAAAIGPGALWRLWRTDTGQALCTAPGGRAITRRAFSPDGGTVALTYDDGSIELRDADLGNLRPLTLSAAAAGGQIVSVSRGGARAVVWAGDATSGHRLVVMDTISGGVILPPLPIDGNYVPPACISADGRRLAYGNSGDIRMVDLESGAVLLDHAQGNSPVGFGPDERQLAVVKSHQPGEREVIFTYATADGAPADTFAAPDEGVYVSALAPDWSFVVGYEYATSLGSSRTLRWPLAGGAPQTLMTRLPIGGLSISTDGALLFDRGTFFHEFTGDYMELNVMDAATGAEVQDFVDHDLSPSADGRRLFGNTGALFCR
jgi:hypothetical protein